MDIIKREMYVIDGIMVSEEAIYGKLEELDRSADPVDRLIKNQLCATLKLIREKYSS